MLPRLALLLASCGTSPKVDVPAEPIVPPVAAPSALPEGYAAPPEAAGLVGFDAEALLAAHPVTAAGLDLDPRTASRRDEIELALELTDAEKLAIDQKGFMVSRRLRHDSYGEAYAEVYARDLPVIVTLDSGFYALHHAWDEALAATEDAHARPALDKLLASTAEKLDTSGEAGSDADVYLAVARAFLADRPPKTQDPANQAAAEAAWTAGKGEKLATIDLYGDARTMPFEQLKPLGHYTKSAGLERYFRAFRWLSLADFPLTGPARDRSFAAAARLVAAIDAADGWDRWHRLDDLAADVGGPTEGVGPTELTALIAELGNQPGAPVFEALASGRYGQARVRTSTMVNDPLRMGGEGLPLSFALLPQRGGVDSAILTNVVYDSVRPDGIAIARTRPDPLDVLFGLGNDHAAPLLTGLDDYAANLELMRRYSDGLPAESWDESVHGSWLSAIRAMNTVEPGAPATFRTEAYGRKLMHTQLVAWAETRHDNQLYLAMSSSGGITCAFTDHYVEPVPLAWSRLARSARAMDSALERFGANEPWGMQHAAEIFDRLAQIAEVEVDGQHLSADDDAFLADLLEISRDPYSGELQWSGWYPSLFPLGDPDKPDRIVGIPHGAPIDTGTEFMHLGLGDVFLMVVTVNTPDGPAAYVGPMQSYSEQWVANELWTDDAWEKRYLAADQPTSAALEPIWVGERGDLRGLPARQAEVELRRTTATGDAKTLLTRDRGTLRYCFLKAGGLGGTLQVELAVTAKGGAVVDARPLPKPPPGELVFSDGGRQDELDRCAVDHARHWTQLPDGEYEAVYEFQVDPPGFASSRDGLVEAAPPPPPIGSISAVRVDGAGFTDAQNDELEVAVKKYAGQLRYCHETVSKSVPGLSGPLRLAIDVQDGKVTDATTRANGTGNTELESCVRSRVLRWRYPEGATGTVELDLVVAP